LNRDLFPGTLETLNKDEGIGFILKQLTAEMLPFVTGRVVANSHDFVERQIGNSLPT
jgi:hypothetical protein